MLSLLLGLVAGAALLQGQADLPVAAAAPTLALLLACALSLKLQAGRQGRAGRAAWLGGTLMRLALGCFLGFFWAAWQAQMALAPRLERADEGRDFIVTGTVDTLPYRFERGARFNFAVERVADAAHRPLPLALVPPRIVLSWYAGRLGEGRGFADVQAGERWRLRVRLQRPHGNANPHGFDYELWLLEQGVRATGYVRDDEGNRRLDGFVFSIHNAIEYSRSALRDRIQRILNGKPYAGVIVALVVGDQRAIGQADWQVFSRTGISHLISILCLSIHYSVSRGYNCSLVIFMDGAMPVAYSYIRFSTPDQKKGDSLRRQIELSERYAEENGLTLDNSLHLHDLGLSAFNRSNIERGALGGFLEAIKRGRIAPGSYLLVESLDRLSRDTVLAALEIFMSILRQGITIVTLADRMVYNTHSVESNFSNLIISISIMARAHEESAMKSQRILAAWENKRGRINEKKLTAQCPAWLRLNESKTKFEIVPERVAVVQEILEWHRKGMGQAQIVKRLNQRGEPVFSKHGKGWHASYIHKIFTTTALYGEYQPHLWNKGNQIPYGAPIPDYYPALISKDEYDLLASRRALRKSPAAKARKGTTVPNLFSGIAKCGYCGSTMILAGGTAQRVRAEDGSTRMRPSKRVLICDGARRGLGCWAVQWAYEDFEASFLMFCRTLELKQLLSEFTRAENDDNRQLTITEKHRSIKVATEDCKGRLDRLVEILELGDTPATILDRIRHLEHELDILKASEAVVAAEVEAIEISVRNRTTDMALVGDLIDSLNSLEGEKLFMARAALAEHIRHVIEVVGVFPAGPLNKPETVARLRSELLKYGSPEKNIDAYLATFVRTEPPRTGRGVRGRYVSRKDIKRFFIIKARNGGYRLIFPNFEDPRKLAVELLGDEADVIGNEATLKG